MVTEEANRDRLAALKADEKALTFETPCTHDACYMEFPPCEANMHLHPGSAKKIINRKLIALAIVVTYDDQSKSEPFMCVKGIFRSRIAWLLNPNFLKSLHGKTREIDEEDECNRI